MDSEKFRSLLDDAAIASDPRSGGLLDYRDLQQLLRRVTVEARALLDERDAMGTRLTRNPCPPPDDLPAHRLRAGQGNPFVVEGDGRHHLA